MRLRGLHHLTAICRDLERSIAFYRDVLGLPIEMLEEYRAGTRPFVSVRVGGQLIDLVPDPTYDGALGGLVHFCVRIEGTLAGQVLSRVQLAGVEVIEEQPMIRLGAIGYGPSIYVRDPDGYVVELKEENPA